MSLFDSFRFVSKSEEREQAQLFAQKVFPFGKPQQDKIRALLAEILPDEPKKLALSVFLIAKNVYIRSAGDVRLENTAEVLRNQLPGKNLDKLPRYMALVVADAAVDERLAYPSASALREEAKQYIRYC